MKKISRFPSVFPSLEALGSGENTQNVAGRFYVGTEEHINTFQHVLFLVKGIIAIGKLYSSHPSAACIIKVVRICGLGQK